jgi:adenine-specific DNA-methyltransferase
MAYLKSWAPRAHNRLTLRVPELLPGPGAVVRGDAVTLVSSAALGGDGFDVAYLDPPYNQHSFRANYHVWETIVAGDEPEHYGVACKRIDTRAPEHASAFNRRAAIGPALAALLHDVDARVVALSYNDEAWVGLETLVELCADGGRRHVEVAAFDAPRYVGSRIGIHNPSGDKVGQVGRTRNVEYLLVASDDRESAITAATAARSATPLGGITNVR